MWLGGDLYLGEEERRGEEGMTEATVYKSLNSGSGI